MGIIESAVISLNAFLAGTVSIVLCVWWSKHRLQDTGQFLESLHLAGYTEPSLRRQCFKRREFFNSCISLILFLVVIPSPFAVVFAWLELQSAYPKINLYRWAIIADLCLFAIVWCFYLFKTRSGSVPGKIGIRKKQTLIASGDVLYFLVIILTLIIILFGYGVWFGIKYAEFGSIIVVIERNYLHVLLVILIFCILFGIIKLLSVVWGDEYFLYNMDAWNEDYHKCFLASMREFLEHEKSCGGNNDVYNEGGFCPDSPPLALRNHGDNRLSFKVAKSDQSD